MKALPGNTPNPQVAVIMLAGVGRGPGPASSCWSHAAPLAIPCAKAAGQAFRTRGALSLGVSAGRWSGSSVGSPSA